MISTSTARALRDAGLAWQPQTGDRFVIDRPELEGEPFVLSDMTVDVHDFPTGRVIGFNGTVEWALDSVRADEALWLPAEHQLRELLGAAFVRLERVGEWWRVSVASGETFSDPAAAEAYGQALLRVLAHAGARGAGQLSQKSDGR
ncbi:MAG: pilus assembly protein CpaE [Actinomycetes bacterium]